MCKCIKHEEFQESQRKRKTANLARKRERKPFPAFRACFELNPLFEFPTETATFSEKIKQAVIDD
jgi:hypothetical protein